MNQVMIKLTISFLSICFFLSNIIAQEADKTLSPYFQIISNHSTTEQLPLQSNTASVNIAGVIADVQIDHKTPICQIYFLTTADL